ncbi:MAG: hypothetical protein ACTSXH_17090 [Promethearchaeota archaeon]
MKLLLKEKFKQFKRKLKDFLIDQWAGNLTEYALLIGFSLFMFFLIVGTVVDLFDFILEDPDTVIQKIKEAFGN